MAVVYIFQAEGTTRVKIGRSGSLQQRQHAIHTASPFPIQLVRAIETKNAVALETLLHHRYKAYRRHREWFELPADVLSALLEERFPLAFPFVSSREDFARHMQKWKELLHTFGCRPGSPEEQYLHEEDQRLFEEALRMVGIPMRKSWRIPYPKRGKGPHPR